MENCRNGSEQFGAITIFEWAFIYTDAHDTRGKKDNLTSNEFLLPAIGSWFRYQHMLHLSGLTPIDFSEEFWLARPSCFFVRLLKRCSCCRGWNMISRVEIPNTLPSVLVGAAHGRAAGRGGAGQTRMPTSWVAKNTKVLQAYRSIVDNCFFRCEPMDNPNLCVPTPFECMACPKLHI